MIHNEYGNNRMVDNRVNLEDRLDAQIAANQAQIDANNEYLAGLDTTQGSASPSSGIAALVLAPAMLIALVTNLAGWWV